MGEISMEDVATCIFFGKVAGCYYCSLWELYEKGIQLYGCQPKNRGI